MSVFGALMTFAARLAYLSLPVYLLRLAADRNPLTQYYFRLVLYVSTLSVCSICGAIISIIMTLIGRRYDINYVTARMFYNVASVVMGIKCTVEGEEHLAKGPYVMMGNHQSMLDIIVLGRIFPRRASIMVKKELQFAPFLGQYVYLSGAVFVDRKNNKDAVAALAAAGAEVRRKNVSLWIFPEGTRHISKESDLLPFKKGGFHLAVRAGVPIIPVICQNYWSIYHKGVLTDGNLKIKVLKPIPTAHLTIEDIPNLVTQTREAMIAALREISDGEPIAASGTTKVMEMRSQVQEEVKSSVVPPSPVTGTGSFTEGSITGTETSEDDGVLVDKP
ncbi:uncharacterized protein EI90DRAFT_3049260 [Cantharellus anzutake]|uniref:uncharacterized protein n=1 Tax=Cantharellus anzutake TaxID=1750568 RepID=UPI0019043956|nr:uncharacterized protein EI90DRAFT_3049260 [Cantharellus anzutake]KAF8335041.1 hypothetical protein EI90DRAFT_3049260 [Cantharellus anzutake]